MTEDCCRTGHLHEGKSNGRFGTLGDLKAYITGNESSPVALLFLHDAFGIKLPNNQLLADFYAEKLDVRVYIPDLFHGEHIPFDMFSNNEVKMDPDYDLQAFLGRHSRSIRESEVIQAAKDLKALPGVRKLGVIGFCWGGWASISLGAYPDLVDAVAVAHPTGISFPDDFEQCKRPILFLCAQHDHTFSDEQRDGGRDILETRSIWNKFVIYKGTNHGFASRGDENNEIEALAMEQAKEETVSFFTKFLR